MSVCTFCKRKGEQHENREICKFDKQNKIYQNLSQHQSGHGYEHSRGSAWTSENAQIKNWMNKLNKCSLCCCHHSLASFAQGANILERSPAVIGVVFILPPTAAQPFVLFNIFWQIFCQHLLSWMQKGSYYIWIVHHHHLYLFLCLFYISSFCRSCHVRGVHQLNQSCWNWIQLGKLPMGKWSLMCIDWQKIYVRKCIGWEYINV